jgi:NAD(P)-dependent dehydrogenase (short-subunit alcohol dehydrogenase family)
LAFLAGLADQGSNANEPRETTFPNRRNAMPFNNKGILITGGAQGIGLGIARAFLKAGARVALIDCNVEAGRAAEQKLAPLGDAFFIEADIAEEAAVKRAVASTLKRFGRLDVLINNAGINIRKPLAELKLEEWQRVIAVNLTGALLCARECAPELARRGGAIVNIASTRALMSEPDSESYAASKSGLVGLTHALAVSLGPKIRINCISPGWIDVSAWRKNGKQEPLSEADHRQHPAGRVGTPEDVARLALFLADPANGFLTGQNLTLDGGMTRKMIYV